MKPLRFVVSLVNRENDYQMAQAKAAEEAGRRQGIQVDIQFAGGDAIEQSQQLLQVVQSSSPCDGILLQPVGTGLNRVAEAAAAAGIGWVVMNREVEYVSELQQKYKVPVFTVSSDHEEEGRIQGRQLAALLPHGGNVLCIQGPSGDTITDSRLFGLNQAKPDNVQVRTIRGKWTEQSGSEAISHWLRLSTSQKQATDAIVSQNDVMAMGARKALNSLSDNALRDKLANVPILGCDGLPASGQAWVRQHLLTATVVVQALAGTAMEILATAIHTKKLPPEHTVFAPTSLPLLNELRPVASARA